MYTYTTPTINCTLEGVEFGSVDYVRIAVRSKCYELVRVVPVSDFDEEGTAAILLTQEETARLGDGQILLA